MLGAGQGDYPKSAVHELGVNTQSLRTGLRTTLGLERSQKAKGRPSLWRTAPKHTDCAAQRSHPVSSRSSRLLAFFHIISIWPVVFCGIRCFLFFVFPLLFQFLSCLFGSSFLVGVPDQKLVNFVYPFIESALGFY